MKTALITGASSGIGSALARLLAARGVSLILSGRNEERLGVLCTELGAKAVVADLRQRSALVNAIREHVPDLLINNAGFGVYGRGIELSMEEQLATLEVNGAAVLELTLEGAKALIGAKKPGTILNVSSIAGELPMPGVAAYGGAKAFVTQISQALDFELRRTGVRVLVSCPGMVATEFASRAAKKTVEVTSGPTMSAEYAAQQILWQIEKGRGKHLFGPLSRWSTWLAARLVPKGIVNKMIEERILRRL